MNQLRKLWAVCCLFLALSACTGGMPAASPLPTDAAPPSPEPTVTAENTPIPATPTDVTSQPSRTSLPTYTPIPPAKTEIIFCYQQLSPGLYLFFSEGYLNTLSANYKSNEFAHVTNSCEWADSLDGRLLLSQQTNDPKNPGDYFIIDALTRVTVTQFSAAPCQDFSLSPDNRWVIAECPSGDFPAPFGIMAISLQNVADRYSVVVMPNERTFSDLTTWSPDGQWLAYTTREQGSGNSIMVNVTNVSCLSNPTTCVAKQARTQVMSGRKIFRLDWSLDGHFLAIWGEDQNGNQEFIMIHDSQTNLQRIIYSGQDKNVLSMSWLPTYNELIVSITGPKTYVFMPNGGTPVYLEQSQGHVLGWRIFLPPFAPGLELSVSLAGHDLNLRAEPSLEGAVLRRLAPGTRLTILEGPIEADGYTWWKMQTEDGSEGWAVEVGVWYQPVSGE